MLSASLTATETGSIGGTATSTNDNFSIRPWEEIEGWNDVPEDVKERLITKEKSLESGYTKKFEALGKERKKFDEEKDQFGNIQSELEKAVGFNQDWQKFYDDQFMPIYDDYMKIKGVQTSGSRTITAGVSNGRPEPPTKKTDTASVQELETKMNTTMGALVKLISRKAAYEKEYDGFEINIEEVVDHALKRGISDPDTAIQSKYRKEMEEANYQKRLAKEKVKWEATHPKEVEEPLIPSRVPFKFSGVEEGKDNIPHNKTYNEVLLEKIAKMGEQ